MTQLARITKYQRNDFTTATSILTYTRKQDRLFGLKRSNDHVTICAVLRNNTQLH